LAQCIKSAIEAVRPFVKSGALGDGFQIEKLDPLLIGDISVNKGLQIDLKDMHASGISNFVVDKIRVNANNFKVSFVTK